MRSREQRLKNPYLDCVSSSFQIYATERNKQKKHTNFLNIYLWHTFFILFAPQNNTKIKQRHDFVPYFIPQFFIFLSLTGTYQIEIIKRIMNEWVFLLRFPQSMSLLTILFSASLQENFFFEVIHWRQSTQQHTQH